MTREEAKRRLLNIERCIPIYNLEEARDIDALDMAIEALEQEPCEDAISRQAVLEYIYNDLGLGDEENGKDVERQMELEKSYRYFKSLSPVTPKPKMGHWINIDETHSKCDRCESVFEITSANGEANYCPNCGARMVESHESEG